MQYDFDTPVERAGTWSTRWDRYAGRDVIPLWVADTDFRAPPAVLAAMRQRVEHGIFGYTAPPDALRQAIVERLDRLYRWRIDPDWIVFIPGVVPGLHLAARTLVPPGARVLVPRPVYQHLKRAPELARLAITELPLQLRGGRWLFDEGEVRRTAQGAAAFFLCNPQNPGGTVFSRSELTALADAAGEALIISDEIHCDLVLEPARAHVPIASLAPEISRRAVTLMSPNKTFNVPSAGCAWAIVEDAKLRRAFAADLQAHAMPSPGVFGYAAALAAYREGDDWLAQQIAYLRRNRDLVRSALPLPMVEVEATYLAWIDCAGMRVRDAHQHFLEHGVALSPGSQFGEPGFVRLNFGTQRARLEQALARMRAAIESASA